MTSEIIFVDTAVFRGVWQAQCPVIRKSWIFAENPGLSVDNPNFCLKIQDFQEKLGFSIDNPSFSHFLLKILDY